MLVSKGKLNFFALNNFAVNNLSPFKIITMGPTGHNGGFVGSHGMYSPEPGEVTQIKRNKD